MSLRQKNDNKYVPIFLFFVRGKNVNICTLDSFLVAGYEGMKG